MRHYIEKFHRIYGGSHIWAVCIALFLFSLLRIPSLVEPYWYGDEGIYQVVGIALREGKTLYREVWDNKPPLLYLIYSFFYGDLFSVRFLSLLFGVGSVGVFFDVSRHLFQRRISIYLSTFLYAILFGLPLLEGNIANAENFMLLPILSSLAFLLRFSHARNGKYLVGSGLFLAFAFLTKIVALFDFLAFFLFLLIQKRYDRIFVTHAKSLQQFLIMQGKRWGVLFRAEGVFTLSFLLPIFVVSGYFFLQGTFADYWRAVFSYNVGYVGYGNYLLFPMGKVVFKMVVLAIAVAFLGYGAYKKRLSRASTFILLWVLFSLFNALFAERPYTHYLLILLPSFCLLWGLLFEERRMLIMHTVVLVVLLVLVEKNFNAYPKSLAYYKNYTDFVFGGKSFGEYRSFFDRATLRDYEIARFLRMYTREDERVFLWTDSAQIYALAGKTPLSRYIVAYHMTFYQDAVVEAQQAIEKQKPKFIIATKDSPHLALFLRGYALRYKIREAKVYERGI